MNQISQLVKEKILKNTGGISKDTFKNSGLLILSSVLAQVINFLCYPFITRSIVPSEFGKYALLLSCVSVFTVFAFGRLELLFPRYKDVQGRFDLFVACLFFFLIVLVLLFFALSFSNYLFYFAKIEYFKNWKAMVIVTFGTMSLLNLLNNYQVGVGSFKLLSGLRLIQPLITIMVTIYSLKFFSGYEALFWGINISNLVCFMLGGVDLFFLRKELIAKFKFDRVIAIIKQNKKMIVINSPHALIDSVQTNFFNVVMGRYYSVTAIGQYSLANRLVRSPMSTIGGAISQVFYKDIHGFNPTQFEQLEGYVKKVLLALLVLSVLAMSVLSIFLKLFFVKIFGINWSGVVPVVFALIPWVIANFVSSPLSQLTIYKNRQGGAIIFGAIYNGATLAVLFLLGIYGFTLIENIFWTSCVGGILNVLFILWILRILKT